MSEDLTKFNAERDAPQLYALNIEHSKFCQGCNQRAVSHYLGNEEVNTNAEMIDASKALGDLAFQQGAVAEGISKMMIDMTGLIDQAVKQRIETAEDRIKFDAYVDAEKVELNALKNVSNKYGSKKQQLIGVVSGAIIWIIGYFMNGDAVPII